MLSPADATRRVLDTSTNEGEVNTLLTRISSENWAKREILADASLTLRDLSGLGALLSCPLCKGSLRRPVFLSTCTQQHHFFCLECLVVYTKEREKASRCPVCLAHYTINQIKVDKQLESVVKLVCGEPVRLAGAEGEEGASDMLPGVWGAMGYSPTSASKRAKLASSGGGGSPRMFFGRGLAGGTSPTAAAEAGAGAVGAAAAAAAAAAAQPAPAGEGAAAAAAPAAAAKPLRERIAFKMELPLPPGFPNPVLSTSTNTVNKRILIVPYTQTVGKNKDYLLEPMATRAAAAQGIPSFSKDKWRLELHVGKAGSRRVQLTEDAVSLCDALRSALRETGQTETLGLARGASGEAAPAASGGSEAPTVPPLGTIYIKAIARE